MTTQKSHSVKNPRFKKNPIEMLENRQTTVKSTKEFKKIGRDVFDQMFGPRSYEDLYSREQYSHDQSASETQKRAPRQEFKLFDKREYQERQETNEKIKEVMVQIRYEIEAIKRADTTLMAEVNDIQKVSLETLSEKPGEYHIKFLEIILSMLKTIKLKISESGTWLEALKTKKKKRGSLFLSLSKRKGTQYSLSQELQSARSVQ